MINHVFISFSVQIWCKIFHIFICILHLLPVDYYKLTMWLQLPEGSIVGRALHWYMYHRCHVFESRSGLILFQALISQSLKLHDQSCLHIHDLSYWNTRLLARVPTAFLIPQNFCSCFDDLKKTHSSFVFLKQWHHQVLENKPPLKVVYKF